MASEKEQKKEVMVDMSELITMLIQETIDADQAVTRDYLNEIQDYAFETKDRNHPQLKTISFEMTDDEGQRQRVTVPLLSLLPLPVLHISEATFDLETQISIVEENTTAEDGNNQVTDEIKPVPESNYLPDNKLVQEEPIGNKVEYAQFAGVLSERLKKRKDVATLRVKARLPKAEVENLKPSTDGTVQQEGESPKPQLFNAKIHVKLVQTPLPSGMMGMLQESDRSITTTLIE